jgi:uncharacterized protein YqjF (DUF2071 family)
MSTPFLTSEWRKLAMANYVIDPSLLSSWIPSKTEIDLFNGKCFISLIGFLFLDTRIMGMKIPFHVNFEEINLRFYVRHGERRGVVFIKEITSKRMVTLMANTIYKENYETLPTSHSIIASPGTLNVQYRWKKADWNVFQVSSEKTPVAIAAGSEEEFITEHYWGFKDDKEYRVEHPRWEVYPVRSYRVDVDFANVYGEAFGFLSKQKPASVFLTEGSKVSVMGQQKIK